jgi:signal peptidase I
MRALFDWVKAIAVAIVLVFLIQTFLFTNYIVHGQSMMPTIEDGTRLIVNKIDYDISQPERFEFIVFHAKENEDYIKRIIGLPGDTIKYVDDVLYINGKAVQEPYLKPFKKGLSNREKLTEDFSLKEATGKKTVPEGFVFVLGDNRMHSFDSRHFGFVPTENIVGKVNLMYWPFSDFRFTN